MRAAPTYTVNINSYGVDKDWEFLVGFSRGVTAMGEVLIWVL